MSPVRSKNSISTLTAAYHLAHKAGFLEWPWFRRSYVAAYFFYKQFYEDSFLNLARRRPELFRNGDILDIGANIGYTACVFAGALTPGWKVYAFEPDRSSHALLEDVIRRKKLTASVEALNLAVGSCESTVEFWHNEAHAADHRVVTDKFREVQSDSLEASTVSMISVDTFVDERKLQSISFIKIDVQGYELAVSEGMRRTLEEFPAACVCIEYSPEGLLELGFDPEKVLDFFRARGYGIYVLTRAGIQPAATNSVIEGLVEKAGYVDLICSRQTLVT